MIDKLIGLAFPESGEQMTFEQFQEFNLLHNSDMYVSIMSLLHDILPCSSYIFE